MRWCEDDSLSVTYTGQKTPALPCSSFPHCSSRNLLMSVTIFPSNEVTAAAVLPARSYCLLLTLTANDTCQTSPITPSFVLLVQALQILACMNTSNHEDNHLTSNSERGQSHSTVHFSIMLFFYSTFPYLLCWSFADDTLQWHFLILDRAGGSTILFVRWIVWCVCFWISQR